MADAGTPAGALAPMGQQGLFEIDLDTVGSNTYGRYPKINNAQTFNMMISDGWLVDYAGFLFIQQISSSGEGRGDLTSTVFNRIFAVVGAEIVYFNEALVPQFVGLLTTTT